MKNEFEYEDNIIELIDEEGNTTKYEHVTTIQFEGKEYIMIISEENSLKLDDDTSEDIDAIVLEMQKDENGEDIYVTIEDEELATRVFEKCIESIDEEDYGD